MISISCSGVQVISGSSDFSIDRSGKYIVFPFSDPPGSRYESTSGKGELFRDRFVRYCSEMGVDIHPVYGEQLTSDESIDIEDAIEIARSRNANHIVFGKVTKWSTGLVPKTGFQISIQGVYSKKVVFSTELSKEGSGYSSGGPSEFIDELSKQMAERACR